MALDYELPVWAVRPNWSEPLLETLEWQTDVLSSNTGAEQRIAYRLTPRRLIETKFNPYQNERTFTDLAMHRLGRNEWMMPLWFDSCKLDSPSPIGGDRINFSTEFHEFSADGMAYLVGPDSFTGEAVRILAVDAGGIDLVVPLTKNWPKGTTIHPMRRGRFESPSSGLLTSRLSELTVRFEIIEGNELPSLGDWTVLNEDVPVLTQAPNWSDRIDLEYSWMSEEFDSGTGRKYVTDEAGRTFRQQRHSFMLVGAQEQYEFRQMLYRLNGRQRPIWLPSQSDDLNVAAARAAGVTQFDIEQVGLTYLGGPSDGRDRLYMPNGQIVEITDAQIIGAGKERLTLATPTTGPLAVGDRLSFIEICRQGGDSVEIEHMGDTQGVAVSTLAFTGFADRRTATTATSGIPVATMNVIPCGTNIVFEGWYFAIQSVLFSNVAGELLTFGTSHGAHNLFSSPFGMSVDNTTGCAAYGSGGFSKCLFGSQAENVLYTEFRYDVEVNPTGRSFRSQRQGGSIGPNTRQLFRYRRWYDDDWTVIMGVEGDGVDAQTSVDGSVDYGNVFPFDNFWTFSA